MAVYDHVNKIHVARTLGAGSWHGLVDPVVGMAVNGGTIHRIQTSGTFQIAVSGTDVGTLTWKYPHEVYTTVAEASGSYGWPSGVGSVTFGRGGVWPDGVPDLVGSGMFMVNGAGRILSFSRPSIG